METYDPDMHWLPSLKPAAPNDEEHDRLLRVARQRIEQGDKPRMVVREMLQAGMPAASLRKVVFFSSVGASESKKKARELTALGAITGFFTGWFSVGVNRDPRNESELELAQLDLDAWGRTFDGSGPRA